MKAGRAGHTLQIIKKQELDVAAKKEILGLVFKKISIKNSARGGETSARIRPTFYEPFQKLFSGEKNEKFRSRKTKNAPVLYQNLRMTIWLKIYHRLKTVLEFIFKNNL